MIWTTDSSGAVTQVGRDWSGFTGQTNADAAGDGWLEVVHKDDRDIAREQFHDALTSNADLSINYRLRRAAGDYARVVSRATPAFGSVGTGFVGYIGYATEIAPTANFRVVDGGKASSRPAARFDPSTIDIIMYHLMEAYETAIRAGQRDLEFAIGLALRRIDRRFLAASCRDSTRRRRVADWLRAVD